MENKLLLKIQSLLTNYFTYFKDKNILVISEDKTVLPFIYLIYQDNTILASISVDYPNSITVADVILIANSVEEVILTDPFYISTTDGNTYFNEEAFHRWDLETIDLNLMDPLSNEQH